MKFWTGLRGAPCAAAHCRAFDTTSQADYLECGPASCRYFDKNNQALGSTQHPPGLARDAGALSVRFRSQSLGRAEVVLAERSELGTMGPFGFGRVT